MKTIAHLSDLHFGTEIPAVVEGVVADVNVLKPSLVVVSGDLTQRARGGQFTHARDFLALLPKPQLIVPGNHDVPLYDVTRRFLAPLHRYRRYINAEVDPVYEDDEMCIVGLNTARSFTWKNGRLSVEQIEAMGRRLAQAGTRHKIVVTHHPFLPPPHDTGIALVGRAARAIPLLDEWNVDLLLAGHLHQGYAGDIRAHYPAARRGIIAAQAGTATSGRTRDEPNAYNWITLERHRITITVRAWNGRAFAPLGTITYMRNAQGWIRVADPAGATAPSTPRRTPPSPH
jgi:3',5'-cyclic AMP phosphodiesterase CpdA